MIDIEYLNFLENILTDNRKERFLEVLAKRTKHFTIAVEDVFQMHNTSAVMRSCEVFGIQELNIIEQRYGKRIDKEIAMGAQKWVDINQYDSVSNCISSLKNKGYQIIATTPHENDCLLEDFDISKGSANEIYKNASKLIFKKLIPNILRQNPTPVSQEGVVVNFKRRTPEQSNIKMLNDVSIANLYDFIRMLDAPSYPKAYLELDNLKMELFEVIIKDGKLEGRFEVSKHE